MISSTPTIQYSNLPVLGTPWFLGTVDDFPSIPLSPALKYTLSMCIQVMALVPLSYVAGGEDMII